ncbi:Cell division protein FtsZ [Candidatus Trichorickettsia mobilis]|uniref:Cell division protein FtsZ n=1 Tax=Candidatus Trichorickettsia mobilis TaxID=1346319 RepID=A0ABZ0UTS7_9RICK|nr:cell division protein FtsZ [Candidatus Trichorickettsia mobilis]WPY00383.1 Cell division protein FtsZ [Candidatus Trichorickettsia mobilis]
MSVSFKAPENIVLKPIITVFGIGGAGGNAVNNMIAANLQGANFVVANTDAQSLEHSLCDNRIQLGATITKGLGAGAAPEVGALAAEESVNEIMGYLEGSNMVFITAGMGGGTGTGASPVIARIAKELGILTVGVVTKPFHFEGAHRMKTADKGLNDLQQFVDTLIVIPNQNLFRIANERTTFADAFKMADDVLHAGVRGVTDLMIMPGLINLDFADIRTIMSEMGKAMMGTGEASGEDRAVRAAEAAISNPLLDHTSMRGARGVLINITGGSDMTLFEVDNAANRIREEVGGDSEANIIFGSTFNPELNGIIRVSVVATGIDAENHVAHIKPTYASTKASSLEETILSTATVATTPTTPASTIYEEEVPQFGNYTMTDSANIVHHTAEPLINTTNTAFRTTEMPGAAGSQNHNNSRSSLLSKMWNSLKSNDKVRTTDDIDYPNKDQVSPSTGSASNNIHEIPAFLRKQQK